MSLKEGIEYKSDRTGWPSGPWDREPDKLNWTTKAGLPGMIVRNRLGGLCGYAAVNPGHPLHGKDYDAVDADIDVHGGLTYASACAGVICHIPEPGQPDDVWWFGFDTVHLGDWAPGERVRLPEDARYRNLAYVKREVERLAEQLAAVKEG